MVIEVTQGKEQQNYKIIWHLENKFFLIDVTEKVSAIISWEQH